MNMKKPFALRLAAVLLLAVMPLSVFGAGGAEFPLDEFKPAMGDRASLQRGAQLFVNYCMGCHSADYMRYGRLAKDLQIPENLVQENLIFDRDGKIGDLMQIGMQKKLAKKWFGAAPPDLTLVSRARKPEWLYTYLRTFYMDPSRPYGVNNLVFKDVGMPHVLLELQGEQVCKPAWAKAANGGVKRDPLTGANVEDSHVPCGRVEHVEGTGKLKPAEYDAAVADLVSFMAYMAEPVSIEDRKIFGIGLSQREVIGVYSLLFLALFGIWAWLLNREYWKDVH